MGLEKKTARPGQGELKTS